MDSRHAAYHAAAGNGRSDETRPKGRTAAVLAITAGAVVLLLAVFAGGVVWGPSIVAGISRDAAASLYGGLVEGETVVERVNDGYGGELVRRVAAVSADIAANAVTQPSLDEATAGALDGLVGVPSTRGEYQSSETHASADSAGDALSGVDLWYAYLAGWEGAGVVEGYGAEPGADGRTSGGTFYPALCGSTGNVRIGLVDGQGVIVLSAVDADTVADLRVALGILLDPYGAQSILVDVRSCTGGNQADTTALCSLFMRGGTVAQVVDASGSKRVTADASAYMVDVPVVLLIGPGTSGGAEVLAGALRDHGVATLVGSRTAGDGTLLIRRTLSFGGAITYAGQSCVTPDGQAIAGNGILPQVGLDGSNGAMVTYRAAFEAAGILQPRVSPDGGSAPDSATDSGWDSDRDLARGSSQVFSQGSETGSAAEPEQALLSQNGYPETSPDRPVSDGAAEAISESQNQAGPSAASGLDSLFEFNEER